MKVCESCGDEIHPRPQAELTASGGWCAPSAVVYVLHEDTPTMCSDCAARMHCIMTLGIDPGRHGENLRVPRGGLVYPIGGPDA